MSSSLSDQQLRPKFFFLVLLCTPFFFFFFFSSISASSHVGNGSMGMKPVESPVVGSMVLNETRRRLGSFQVCALCTCCGGPQGLCLPSPCCYAINCNIPNRPFGFCSFTPKACNCLDCSL